MLWKYYAAGVLLFVADDKGDRLYFCKPICKVSIAFHTTNGPASLYARCQLPLTRRMGRQAHMQGVNCLSHDLCR